MTSSPSDFEQLRKWTAQESVAERLRRDILSGRLPSGTRLIQADIAKRLGVSVTPVREALRSLEVSGLLDVDDYRGFTVHAPTLEEIEDVFELLLAVTPLATRRATLLITEKDFEELQNLHDQMCDVTHIEDFAELNRAFHLAFYRTAASPRITRLLESLSDEAESQVALAERMGIRSMRDSCEEHQQILDGIRARDVDAIINATNRHLRLSLDSIRETATANEA